MRIWLLVTVMKLSVIWCSIFSGSSCDSYMYILNMDLPISRVTVTVLAEKGFANFNADQLQDIHYLRFQNFLWMPVFGVLSTQNIKPWSGSSVITEHILNRYEIRKMPRHQKWNQRITYTRWLRLWYRATYLIFVYDSNMGAVLCFSSHMLHNWIHIEMTKGFLELWVGRQYLRSLIARFMRPKWGPSGAGRTHMGLILAPWTLLSGVSPGYYMDIIPAITSAITYVKHPTTLSTTFYWRPVTWSITWSMIYVISHGIWIRLSPNLIISFYGNHVTYLQSSALLAL